MSQPANSFKAYLAQKLEAGGAETIIYLDRITAVTGETITTSDLARLGRGIVTVNPEADGRTYFPEFISFTGVDANAISLTGASRGLSAKGNSTVTANKRFHPAGTPVIISFGVHNILDILDYVDDEVAAVTAGSNIVVTGSAGETVSAGQLVYLKNDGLWWKCDADTAATVEGVQLGIAQGAGTAGNSITGGVLRKGTDGNQSGLVSGTTYYAGNTAGAISSSAGTNSRIVGVGRSTTALYFDPEYGLLPSIGQKEALSGEGDSAPSSANKFLTSSSRKIEVFTADGTYTKPSWAKFAEVFVIGGGGGGGGGAVDNASSSDAGGGGGGGGGGFSYYVFDAANLPGTVAITRGAGGAGGAGKAAGSNGSGATGTAGGTSSFGTYLSATGGGAGGGGTQNSAGAAGTAGTGNVEDGGAGGAGSAALAVNGGTGGSVKNRAGAGGGGGGHISSTSAQGGPGGGRTFLFALSGGAAGVGAGGSGSAGSAASISEYAGGAGGGGGNGADNGSNSARNGGDGGNGGAYGAGGGGGGVTSNTTYRGGNGGNGANGVVVVITY